MNKKFSTLLTAGLLVGGSLLVPANATKITSERFKQAITEGVLDLDKLKKALGDDVTFDGKIELTGDVTGDSGIGWTQGYVVVKDKDITITSDKEGENRDFEGRIIVAAEGVTIENLDFSKFGGTNGYWNKTAITAFADKVTVKGNTFDGTGTASGNLANGIVLYPQTANVAWEVSGNTFTGLDQTANDQGTAKWYSSAIQVYLNTEAETKDKDADPLNDDDYVNLNGSFKGDATPKAVNFDFNEFEKNNKFDATSVSAKVFVRNQVDLSEDGVIEYAEVGSISGKETSATAATLALVEAASKSTEETALKVDATAEAISAVLSNSTLVDANAGKELAKKNLVVYTIDNPVVIGQPAYIPDNAVYVSFDTNSGSAVKYVAEAVTEKVDKGTYLLMSTDGKAVSAANMQAADFDPKDPELFLWTLEYNKIDSKVYFYNAKKKAYLTSNSSNKVSADTDAKKRIEPSQSWQLTGDGSATTYVLGNYAVPTAPITAGELASIFGTSFPVTIEYANAADDDEKELAKNPFDGAILTPVEWKSSDYKQGEVKAADKDATSYMLQKENGKIVVLQLTDQYAATIAGQKKYAYRLIEIDAKELAESLKKEEGKYLTQFSFESKFNLDLDEEDAVSRIVVTDEDDNRFELGSISLSNVNTLAAADPAKNYLDEVTVSLKTKQTLKFKDLMTGQFYTVTNKNTRAKYSNDFGKVLGVSKDATKAEFRKASEVLVGYPETQWAVTSDGKFTNRENTRVVKDFLSSTVTLYKVAGSDNLYSYADKNILGYRDTIEIKAVDKHAASDGFLRFNDVVALKDQLFHIGSYSAVRDTAFVTENHKENHQVGLDTEVDNTTAWRLVPLMYMEEDVWGDPIEGTLTPDTISIISKLGYINADDEYKPKSDTLKVIAYAFRNSENGEYLAYDNARDRYTTGDEKDKDGYATADKADYFALKIMGGDSTRFNLVQVPGLVSDNFSKSDEDETDGNKFDYYYEGGKDEDGNRVPYTTTKAFSEKIYAGETAAKGILNKCGAYEQNESDLFTISEKAAPEYLKLSHGQIIKLYREEYAESESNVLYEKGGFLGIGNAVENAKINPAMYVEVAHNEGNRWEYLLAVRTDSVMHRAGCGVPEHGTVETGAIDTLKGDFLVNFADSAIVAEGKEDIHVNKYMYTNGENWAKLGFVYGELAADGNLYIGENEDKIAVNTAEPQLVKFAFRVVDNDTKAFVIETGYKDITTIDNETEDNEIEKYGYLRYDNGEVYVTNDIREAEVFMLKDDNRDAVANEEVEISGVSVAATNGAIIVKGAAGKNVVITNVLGQTIASTVVASDEAQIAAPAGVVIVAVEGEDAVKAIVK